MKKFVKGAGLSLCAMLLLAGCSCNKDEKDTTANISNQDDKILDGLKDGVDSISLEKLYNELRNEKGNETAANKLLQMVSDLVLSDATWEARYEAKVQYYLDELKNMGANVKISGRTAYITGVERLTGCKVCAQDLRGGAALVLAGLNADGQTVVEGVNHIRRGYLDFDKKLRSIGANIKIME
jgi:hypothetical protein